MNYLFIDTSINHEIRVAVLMSDELNFFVEKIENEFSEKLITFIDRLLQDNNIRSDQINKIFVIVGPGRFSALRTGVTTANVFAWQLDIPVISMPGVGLTKDYWEEVINQIKKIKGDEHKFNKNLVPEYGKEPNITIIKEKN